MVNGQAVMDPLRTARATPPKAAMLPDLHSMARATPTTVILPELPLALATPIKAILHELPMALATQTTMVLNLSLATLAILLNMALATAQNMVLAALTATDPPHTTGIEDDHCVLPSCSSFEWLAN